MASRLDYYYPESSSYVADMRMPAAGARDSMRSATEPFQVQYGARGGGAWQANRFIDGNAVSLDASERYYDEVPLPGRRQTPPPPSYGQVGDRYPARGDLYINRNAGYAAPAPAPRSVLPAPASRHAHAHVHPHQAHRNLPMPTYHGNEPAAPRYAMPADYGMPLGRAAPAPPAAAPLPAYPPASRGGMHAAQVSVSLPVPVPPLPQPMPMPMPAATNNNNNNNNYGHMAHNPLLAPQPPAPAPMLSSRSISAEDKTQRWSVLAAAQDKLASVLERATDAPLWTSPSPQLYGVPAHLMPRSLSLSDASASTLQLSPPEVRSPASTGSARSSQPQSRRDSFSGASFTAGPTDSFFHLAALPQTGRMQPEVEGMVRCLSLQG